MIQNININTININEKDYICISDIAKAKSDKSRAADVIRNWLRNRSTLDFLTAWEQLYNPNFKVFESEHFRKQVGLLTFTPIFKLYLIKEFERLKQLENQEREWDVKRILTKNNKEGVYKICLINIVMR